MKDAISLVLSAISVAISAYTFWLVQFNRGRLMMTRPTYLSLKRDPGPNWPKLFMRTCLYSTGAKGMAVENLYLFVHQTLDRRFVFDYWGHTDSGQLTIGSGLYVGPTGIANDHHFNFRSNPDEFLPEPGDYRIEVFATVAGKKPIKISELEFVIDNHQSAELIQIPSNRQLDLVWDATQEKYIGEVRALLR
ncbi:hypothetical protein [Paraburkholderia tropica]|uniref:hypothetical protein n=1 Tax=Paraburkholderia tropica TaxID=92647 RepID=UPI002AB605DC|nr:hypothetical protein [Paraburkholderia tropica]